MKTEIKSWEAPLISLASLEKTQRSVQVHSTRLEEPEELTRAYDYCDRLTAHHSRSFHLASALLPGDKRRAARALYAFCRVTDDLVDEADSAADAVEKLEAWRAASLSEAPGAEDPVALAWADARARYAVPERYAQQLIDGVRRDLRQTRYETFEDLASYAYGVAATVGLMSMHVVGFATDEAIPYAIRLGVALQNTNILRDVAEDWNAGRLYLPTEDLNSFGLDEEDVAAGQVTSAWKDFMRFSIERNRRLYSEAWPGIGLLDPDGRFAIAAAAEMYRGILDDIEAHDYDVFRRRAYVGRWKKIRRLPGIWWRVKRNGRSNAAAATSDRYSTIKR